MLTEKHLKVGRLGESIAVRYLKLRNFRIVQRNYRRKYGEIDIIAEKDNILHFIEVKSVSRETRIDRTSSRYVIVSRGTLFGGHAVGMRGRSGHVSCETVDRHVPQQNIHSAKVKRLSNTILAYVADKDYPGEWTFSYLTVDINLIDSTALVNFIADVALN